MTWRAAHSTRWQRLISLLLALTVAFTFATSSIAISHELHHDCAGDGCAVCAEMATGLHLARGGCSLPGAPAALTAGLLLCAFLPLGAVRCCTRLTTLVSLKVQLND